MGDAPKGKPTPTALETAFFALSLNDDLSREEVERELTEAGFDVPGAVQRIKDTVARCSRGECPVCGGDQYLQPCPHCGIGLGGIRPEVCPTRKITLCGSTRFKRAWMEWNARLTLEGHLVYSVAMWSHNTRIEPTEEQKQVLDRVHLAKIDASDEIFVLDVGGYIGESTRREIAHAEVAGKVVRYLSREYPLWTEDDCLFARDERV